MSGANAKKRIEEKDRPTLVAVLDEIIPPSPDGRLPGAGQAGLAESIIKKLASQPPQQEAVANGLTALDAEARRRDAADFASLARDDRAELMQALETDQPAFIPSLLYLTYTGYYQLAEVVAALGLETWPPHPGGFTMVPSDVTLVDPVRNRGKLYRE